MFLVAVYVRLTRLLLSFLGLTSNDSADELFLAQDPQFGTRFHYISERDVVLDFLGRTLTLLCLKRYITQLLT